MQIAILGPLTVRDDAGSTVDIAGTRLRTLLTRLAVDAGRPVGVTTLVDTVWGDEPPAAASNALQTLVSRLRRALGAAVLEQSTAGYRIAIDPADVDAVRFTDLAARATEALRRGDASEASTTLDAALALWRGPALADTREASDELAERAARLDAARVSARLDRVAALLALDSRRVDLDELAGLVRAQPLDERAAGLHIRALASVGRTADALHAYQTVRATLGDELGVDPSADLQQLHLDLLRDDAPVRTRRTNLKAPLTSFVGRETEVVRITKTLETNRLVTLVGPGGAGKTRLAAESAQAISDRAPDGIWLAELANVTAGADVPQAVLGSVGLRELHLIDRSTGVSARDALSRLREGLADWQAVLILDNCEHVIEASASLAEQLLGECPDLRVLATSREPLGIFGEALLAVPALGQPAATASAAEALEYPAVRLFADRAAAVAPDFTVDDATVPAVIEIVRRLDGLPLAIELAAARLRAVPIDEIAHRLSDRFRLLTGGSRTALPRHRTLRAVVEWSWDLLTPAERRMAEQLAVFPAGITRAAATAVRPDGVASEDVADLIASLVEKSLLQPVDDGRRTRMLETIREYGVDRLAERGDLAAARERHAGHFAALLDEAARHLTTADQLPWFEIVGVERENIVAALRQRCDVGDADGACLMAVQLSWYGMMLGDHGDLPTLLTEALSVPGGSNREFRLMARAALALNVSGRGANDDPVAQTMDELNAVARELEGVSIDSYPPMALFRPAVAYFAEDRERTQRFMAEALADADPWTQAATRMFMAMLAENEGDIATMREQTELAMTQFRALGERWGLASTLRNLGAVYLLDGRLDAAAEAYEESLRLVEELNSYDDKLFAYARLADIGLRRGDHAAARRYAELAKTCADVGGGIEAVFFAVVIGDIERRLGDHAQGRALHRAAMHRLAQLPREHPMQGHLRTYLLIMSGRLALDDGDLDAAAQAARDAHAAAVGTNDLPILADAGVLAAQLEATRGRLVEAAELLGAAARLRGAEDPTALDIAALTAALRNDLGDPAFDVAYAQGRALAKEAASDRLRQLSS